MALNKGDRAKVRRALHEAMIIPKRFEHAHVEAFLDELEHADVDEIEKIASRVKASKITKVLANFPPNGGPPPPPPPGGGGGEIKPAKKRPGKKRATKKKPAKKKPAKKKP